MINSSGAVTIVISLLILLLTYTYLPGGKRSIKSQLPGAVLTSIIWAVFSLFFSFFIPRFWKASSLYGSLASVFLVAMWLQTMMTILFYGAALNTVLEEEKQRQKKLAAVKRKSAAKRPMRTAKKESAADDE